MDTVELTGREQVRDTLSPPLYMLSDARVPYPYASPAPSRGSSQQHQQGPAYPYPHMRSPQSPYSQTSTRSPGSPLPQSPYQRQALGVYPAGSPGGRPGGPVSPGVREQPNWAGMRRREIVPMEADHTEVGRDTVSQRELEMGRMYTVTNNAYADLQNSLVSAKRLAQNACACAYRPPPKRAPEPQPKPQKSIKYDAYGKPIEDNKMYYATDGLITCYACGAKLFSDSKYCHSCATKINLTCIQCGEKTKAPEKRCASCYHELPQDDNRGQLSRRHRRLLAAEGVDVSSLSSPKATVVAPGERSDEPPTPMSPVAMPPSALKQPKADPETRSQTSEDDRQAREKEKEKEKELEDEKEKEKEKERQREKEKENEKDKEKDRKRDKEKEEEKEKEKDKEKEKEKQKEDDMKEDDKEKQKEDEEEKDSQPSIAAELDEDGKLFDPYSVRTEDIAKGSPASMKNTAIESPNGEINLDDL